MGSSFITPSTKILGDLKPLNPLSIEDTQNNKKHLLDVVNLSINKYKDNLNTGTIEIKSIADLEKLVKMSLLLTGEPDSITSTTNTTELGVTLESTNIQLDLNDSSVKEVYEKLFGAYNEKNEEVGEN